jgi:hypothetical protein
MGVVKINLDHIFKIITCSSKLLKTYRKSLENQFIYPIPRGSKFIFFAPLGVGVNEENQIPGSINGLIVACMI